VAFIERHMRLRIGAAGGAAPCGAAPVTWIAHGREGYLAYMMTATPTRQMIAPRMSARSR
jgi:hypothetical protein